MSYPLCSATRALALTFLLAVSAGCFPQLRDLPEALEDPDATESDTHASADSWRSDDTGVADTVEAAIDTSAVSPHVDAVTDATDALVPGDGGPIVVHLNQRWVVDKVMVCAEEPLPDTGWDYSCDEQSTFATDDAVFVLLSLGELEAETLRFGADFFHEERLQWSWADIFRDVTGWDKASTWPTGSNLAAGSWTVDLLVDCGDGFEPAATASFIVAP